MLVNGGSWLRKQSVKEGALTTVSMNLFNMWYKRIGNELSNSVLVYVSEENVSHTFDKYIVSYNMKILWFIYYKKTNIYVECIR